MGKDAFFWSAKERLTSASETLMSCFSASCWTHSAWIRNCMTSRLSVSYSVLHCFLSAAGVGFGVPLGTGALPLAATHFVKSGGSGTAVCAACA